MLLFLALMVSAGSCVLTMSLLLLLTVLQCSSMFLGVASGTWTPRLGCQLSASKIWSLLQLSHYLLAASSLSREAAGEYSVTSCKSKSLKSCFRVLNSPVRSTNTIVCMHTTLSRIQTRVNRHPQYRFTSRSPLSSRSMYRCRRLLLLSAKLSDVHMELQELFVCAAAREHS
jgi:hypothetical protein